MRAANLANRFFGATWSACGLSKVAVSAGVSTSATTTDSAIEDTMVIENWR